MQDTGWTIAWITHECWSPSELYSSSWTSANKNCPASTEHHCNRGCGGEGRMKPLFGKHFQNEKVAAGSCLRGWDVRNSSRGTDQQSECPWGQQRFWMERSLSDLLYSKAFPPHEIMASMPHAALFLKIWGHMWSKRINCIFSVHLTVLPALWLPRAPARSKQLEYW